MIRAFFGGKRHRRDIGATPLLQRFCPDAFAIGLVRRQPQRRAGAVNQQGAQGDIASLADCAELGLATTGIFSWCQPQPGRELSAVLEGAGIADTGNEGGCGNRTDTFNRHQTASWFGGFGQDRYLAVVGQNSLVECPQTAMQFANGFTRQDRQLLTTGADVGHERALGNHPR